MRMTIEMNGVGELGKSAFAARHDNDDDDDIANNNLIRTMDSRIAI